MASSRAPAFSLSREDDKDYDVPRNGSHSTRTSSSTDSSSSSMSDGSDALQRMQTTLTAAIEHMECAQVEFFHVNRAFEARKRQEQQQRQNGRDGQQGHQELHTDQVPWSVKVQLYCEFWQQFLNQLRDALHGDRSDAFDDPDTSSSSNEQSLKALSLLASNVWGETRASPQEVFKNGPIVLSPRQVSTKQRKLKSKLKTKQTDALVRESSEQRLLVSAAATAVAVPTVFNGIGPHLEVSNWVASSTTSSVKSKKDLDNGSEMMSTNGGPRKKAKTMKTKASTTAAVPTTTIDMKGAKRNTMLSSSNGSEAMKALTVEPPSGTAAVALGTKLAAVRVEKLAPRRYLSTKPLCKSKSGRVLGRFVPGREHTRANETAETDNARANIPEPASSTTNHPASTTMVASPLRKKKITARLVDRERVPAPTTEAKQGGIDADEELDEGQAELLMVPVESAISEAMVRIKEGIAERRLKVTPKLSTSAKRSKDRYLLYARLRHRIQGQLRANEVWPDLVIPFPAHLLVFDPDEHPQLVNNHRKFWITNIGAYVEMVFYHPQAEDLARVAQGKVQLRKRQRELLSEYIETLGVHEVAQRLHKQPEANFAFFFAKTNIRLDELSSEQLDAHFSFLRKPWKSPMAREKQLSWWETLYTTASGKPRAIQMSEAAEQQIVRAHFRGELDFDENWLRFANESPWKEMLDELKVVVASPITFTNGSVNDNGDDKVDENIDDDGDEHDFPQSPPRRKKIAGKVPVNREGSMKASGTSSEPAERLRWFQQRLSERERTESSSGCSPSTGDDADNDSDDFIEQAGGRRIRLGKRLRTSK